MRDLDKNFCGSTKRCRYEISQPAITCPKLTIETLEQGVKYVPERNRL